MFVDIVFMSFINLERWCHSFIAHCHLRSPLRTISFLFLLFYLGESSSSPDPTSQV